MYLNFFFLYTTQMYGFKCFGKGTATDIAPWLLYQGLTTGMDTDSTDRIHNGLWVKLPTCPPCPQPHQRLPASSISLLFIPSAAKCAAWSSGTNTLRTQLFGHVTEPSKLVHFLRGSREPFSKIPCKITTWSKNMINTDYRT